MKDDEPIDLLQDFVAQHAREDMLAFFEFSMPRTGAAAISGLCRISEPKSGSSQLRYVSLTFMIDSPDSDSRQRIEEALGRLEDAGLQTDLPEVVSVLPAPSMGSDVETTVRQLDLLLDDVVVADQAFIEQRLIPTIGSVAEIAITGVTWWAKP